MARSRHATLKFVASWKRTLATWLTFTMGLVSLHERKMGRCVFARESNHFLVLRRLLIRYSSILFCFPCVSWRPLFQNEENRTGIYQHPIIQDLLNKTWFASPKDDGPNFVDSPDNELGDLSITVGMLGLILTAVMCSLRFACLPWLNACIDWGRFRWVEYRLVQESGVFGGGLCEQVRSTSRDHSERIQKYGENKIYG